MGLLDTALGMLGGGADADPKIKLAEAAFGMLSNHGENGGLQGLLNAFQQAGLGDQVASWVGNGENLPISGEQIQQALASTHLDQLAQAAGISNESAANHLAEILPGIVNQLTPNGQVESNPSLGSVTSLLGQFLGK